MDWKGTGGLGQRRGFHCILVSMYPVPSNYLSFSHWPSFYLQFLWGNGVKRPNSSSVLVLDAKGRENKAKATGSATTCEVFFKSFSVRILYCKNCSLMGRNSIMGKRGSFGVWSKLVLKDILVCQNKCFYIKIQKWICFAKTNQVVAKVIQICQILW